MPWAGRHGRASLVVPSIALAVAGAAVPACAPPPSYAIGPPPATQTVSTVPAAIDSAGVKLDPVPPGQTTTTAVAVTPGPATIGGVVNGPGGAPVPGATVRLERVVGRQRAHVDVAAGPDGRWSVAPPAPGKPVIPGPGGEGLVGGLYHVRAWRSPDLVMTATQTVNVLVGRPAVADLTVAQLGGVLVAGDLGTEDPAVGVPVALLVQYTVREVSADGQVEERPVANAPVLSVSGAWLVTGGLPAVTNGQGQVLLRVQCVGTGRQPLHVSIAGLQPAEVAAPTCKPPAPSTTTTTRPPVLAPSSTPSTRATTTSSTGNHPGTGVTPGSGNGQGPGSDGGTGNGGAPGRSAAVP